jgi:predicted DNA-binding transcriptional regulator AlpA
LQRAALCFAITFAQALFSRAGRTMRVLKMKDVAAKIGRRPTWIYNKLAKGLFPRPIGFENGQSLGFIEAAREAKRQAAKAAAPPPKRGRPRLSSDERAKRRAAAGKPAARAKLKQRSTSSRSPRRAAAEPHAEV